MVKILMYSARPDEQPAITHNANVTGDQIDGTPDPLTATTVDQAAGYDGIVIGQRVAVGDAAVYQRLAELGIHQVSTRTAGYDVIDLKAAHAAGLTVTNVPAYSPRSVAEYALMSIFRLLRHTATIDQRVAQHDYRWNGLQAKEIHTATIGIIGAGRIGGTLAQLLHLLGATVLAYDVAPRPDLDGIVTYVEKDELLRHSDVVSLHVDLNPSSTHLLTARDFALMPAGSGLVNASRGPVVDTAALITALESGHLGGAVLDTVEGEGPIFALDHREDGLAAAPLLAQLQAIPTVTVSPHVAFYTNEAVQNMVDTALADVHAILTGAAPLHPVG